MLPARGIGGRPTKGGESAAARSSGRRQWWRRTGARVWSRSKRRRRGRASGLGADKDARNEVRRRRRPTRGTGNEDGRCVDSRDACIARRSRGAADRPGLHPDCPAGVVTIFVQSIFTDTGTWLLLASCAAEAVAKPIPRFHVPALLPCFARTRKNTKALQRVVFPVTFLNKTKR